MCRAEGDAVTCREAFKMVPLSVLPCESKNMPKCAVREEKRGLIKFSLPTSLNPSALFLMPMCLSGFRLTALYSLFTQWLLENGADRTLLHPYENYHGRNKVLELVPGAKAVWVRGAKVKGTGREEGHCFV